MNKYKNTEVRIIDSAKPIAYSMTFIKNIVFLSVGLLDILNKKEVESVVLHELSHIKSKSSLLKFSAGILRKLSPFSIVLGFSSDLDKEEKKADKFASEMQGTNKHIRSARNKIEYFYRECNR